MLSALSAGRVMISIMCVNYLRVAICIAIRCALCFTAKNVIIVLCLFGMQIFCSTSTVWSNTTGRAASLRVSDTGLINTLSVLYPPSNPSHNLSLSLQQWRLLPYMATVYVFTCFSNRLYNEFINFTISSMMGDRSERQVIVHIMFSWLISLRALCNCFVV